MLSAKILAHFHSLICTGVLGFLVSGSLVVGVHQLTRLVDATLCFTPEAGDFQRLRS